MKYTINIYKKTLNFTFKAGTSRGYYTEHTSYILKILDNNTGFVSYGECSTLPKLSFDDIENYEDILKDCALNVQEHGILDIKKYANYPSIIFGFEMALMAQSHKSDILFDNAFTKGLDGIKINGLIWMGDFKTMQERLVQKIKSGFKCIKIKIGAIDFDKELELLHNIRSQFDKSCVEIRVDANGAFDMSNCKDKLMALKRYDLHSIEQPIKAGAWDDMAKLCQNPIIDIALDEELIGLISLESKIKMLDTIKPQYIVLKPSLHGGICGCNDFIYEAKKRNIGYWLTSALESNIALNAIAQYAASQNISMPQGLGTGLLYSNNIENKIYLKCTKMYFNASLDKVDYDLFLDDCIKLM